MGRIYLADDREKWLVHVTTVMVPMIPISHLAENLIAS